MIDKWTLFKELGYVPHPEQRLFHNSTQRFRVPCCGRRFGKSQMAAKDMEAGLFEPNTLHWIVGPTYGLGEKEFRVIWNDLMVNPKFGFIRDKRFNRKYNVRQGEMYIEFPWHTRLQVMSAGNPDQLVGESVNHVILSEAARHDESTWEQLIRPTLADTKGRADFPSTPQGYNWYYELWLMGQQPDEAYASWRFPSWMNTHVFPGGRDDPEIKLAERGTDRVWFNQEYGAEFASFVGKIYDEFNRQTHVRGHTYQPEWPNYIAFDWGFSNPMAAMEFQVTPSEDIYVWREYYEKFKPLSEALYELRSRPQPDGYHVDLTFGDSADPQSVLEVNRSFAPCVAMPEAKQNWRQGINVVKRYLNEYHDGTSYDEFERPIMVPKLFIDPSCTNAIREFENYKTKESTGSIEEASKAGSAQKVDDHALDALRYAFMHLFELGVRSSLSDLMPSAADMALLQGVSGAGHLVGVLPRDGSVPLDDFEILERAVKGDSGMFTLTGSFTSRGRF